MKPGTTAHIPFFCALNSESILVFALKPQTSEQQRYGPIISDFSFGTFFEYWYDSGCFKLLRKNSLIKGFVYDFGKDACEIERVICNFKSTYFGVEG